jgi:hypothetical protein
MGRQHPVLRQTLSRQYFVSFLGCSAVAVLDGPANAFLYRVKVALVLLCYK